MSRMRRRRARASSFVWVRKTSSIWRPTGTTGLSAVIGSWKIIAMVVARNCRKRRSLAVSSSSPTSLTLPPVGTSEPLCNSPITVSAVTDLPEPLSPTRQRVSRSRTCSETPSMTWGFCGLLPRLTTRFWMSRTGEVMLTLPLTSLRAQRSNPLAPRAYCGLLRRFAPRNDVVRVSFTLPPLHAGIERVARGVTDQIDGQDRDRQQQARPEDQRRLDLKIGAAFRHDVAPGRGLRADAGAEKRQDRFGEDRGRADVSALHDQGRDRVRHQVPPHDLRQTGAQ